jgi:hypothetical protein
VPSTSCRHTTRPTASSPRWAGQAGRPQPSAVLPQKRHAVPVQYACCDRERRVAVMSAAYMKICSWQVSGGHSHDTWRSPCTQCSVLNGSVLLLCLLLYRSSLC